MTILSIIFTIFIVGAVYSIATNPRLKELCSTLLVIFIIVYVFNETLGVFLGLVFIIYIIYIAYSD